MQAVVQTPSFVKSVQPTTLAVCCFLIVFLFSVMTWLLFGTFYGTVDDPYMILVAKGYLMNEADWHLFFIHPIIGFLLVILYRDIPNVPWYVLFMVSVNSLSFSAILYAILRRSFSWLRILLWTILMLLAGIYLIACVQFTMVSAMACSAGVTLLLGEADRTSISRMRLAIAVGFFLLGAAVRIHPALLVILMVGPCALYLWFSRSLPGARRFALGVFAGLILLNFLDTGAYQIVPAWREARLYDSARGILNATEVMKNYEDNANVFKAVGWSKNDLTMFNAGLYQDSAVYSKENLRYLVDHLRLPAIGFERLFWSVFIDLFEDIQVFLLYLTALVFVLAWRLMPRLQVFVLVGPCLAVFCYLAVFVRLPYRVLCPALFMELAILGLFCHFEATKIKLRTTLFGVIVLLLISGPLLNSSISGLYKYALSNAERKRSTVEALDLLSQGDSPIIVNTVSGTAADETYLWQDFPELRHVRLMQMAWFNSPIYDQRMQYLGLHDIFSDLAQRPDMVVAVTRWDLAQIVAIETFLREHRGIHVRFELAKIPGTEQDAVFPYFSLFSARIDR
jgi:hypothetical protein